MLFKFIIKLKISVFVFLTISVYRDVDSKGIIKIPKNNNNDRNQDFRSFKYITSPYMDPYTKTGRRSKFGSNYVKIIFNLFIFL
jgi:hypothetical protein